MIIRIGSPEKYEIINLNLIANIVFMDDSIDVTFVTGEVRHYEDLASKQLHWFLLDQRSNLGITEVDSRYQQAQKQAESTALSEIHDKDQLSPEEVEEALKLVEKQLIQTLNRQPSNVEKMEKVRTNFEGEIITNDN